jgi:hypothetical protein
MFLRVQQSVLFLLLRRIRVVQSYASISTSRRDHDRKEEYDERNTNDNDTNDNRANVTSMIGPYISSKQIAFHTGQFDSDHITKKNKQAFLVGQWIVCM